MLGTALVALSALMKISEVKTLVQAFAALTTGEQLGMSCGRELTGVRCASNAHSVPRLSNSSCVFTSTAAYMRVRVPV